PALRPRTPVGRRSARRLEGRQRPGRVMNILGELRSRFRSALLPLSDDPDTFAAMVKPAQDARFGDYQANCAMPLAKQCGVNLQDLAREIIGRLELADLCEVPEVAGPGFINLRLRTDWLAQQVQSLVNDDRLGVAPAATPRRIIVDYSSPNVAKPMH